MLTYPDLYKKGLTYFQKYLDLLINDLSKNRSICITAAYKLGDRRFLAYLAFTLEQSGNYTVFHDDKNEFTAETLEHIQEFQTNKQKVLILPYYDEKDTRFKSQFLQLMKNRGNTFLSITRVSAEFLEKPERYFPQTNLPMESVYVMTPFSAQQSEEIIVARELLDDIQVNSAARKFIIKTCGGHAGLIKRACTVYRQEGRVTTDLLLHDPPTKAELLQLEYQIRTLSPHSLQKIGLVNTKGTYSIPLLDNFMSYGKNSLEDALSPSEIVLLQLFRTQKGKPVTLEMVHKLLHPEEPYSMWATYKAVSRFGNSVSSAYRLVNVKGKGYLLVDKAF